MIPNRLYNQRIARSKKGDSPAEVVAWFGALQAQDRVGVKWAIGLRSVNLAESSIDGAIADGSILRTWLMRGTLHMVAAEDVLWMLTLLRPRLLAGGARRYRQLGLDQEVLSKSFAAISNALDAGLHLTRDEIRLVLEEAGIATNGQRLYHILRHAALEGLICFGVSVGKQETFMKLDDRASTEANMKDDEALAELTLRYFRSHGPATLEDFIWWSGLTRSAARTALSMLESLLQEEIFAGKSYWSPRNSSDTEEPSSTVYLLPAFDEYYLGYKDRTAILDPKFDKQVVSSNGVFRPMLVIDGQVVGIWRRVLNDGEVEITPVPFSPLTGVQCNAIVKEANRYGGFLNSPVKLVWE